MWRTNNMITIMSDRHERQRERRDEKRHFVPAERDTLRARSRDKTFTCPHFSYWSAPAPIDFTRYEPTWNETQEDVDVNGLGSTSSCGAVDTRHAWAHICRLMATPVVRGVLSRSVAHDGVTCGAAGVLRLKLLTEIGVKAGPCCYFMLATAAVPRPYQVLHARRCLTIVPLRHPCKTSIRVIRSLLATTSFAFLRPATASTPTTNDPPRHGSESTPLCCDPLP